MNPEHKEARWAEVLNGKRLWEQPKLCPGDDDKFRTEYVDPLKALQSEGRFEIAIITHNLRGRAEVPIAVKIVGSVNYD
jgi:hypothetical protein